MAVVPQRNEGPAREEHRSLRRYTGPMSLHGVCTIALTPFTDEGDLDEEGIGPLSESYVDAGVHGITILGIMARSFAQS